MLRVRTVNTFLKKWTRKIFEMTDWIHSLATEVVRERIIYTVSQNELPNYQVQIIADVSNSAGVEFYPGIFRNYGKHFLPAFELIISHNYCSSDGNFPAVSDLQKFWALGKSCLITILRHIMLPNSWNYPWNEGEIVSCWKVFRQFKKNFLLQLPLFLNRIHLS